MIDIIIDVLGNALFAFVLFVLPMTKPWKYKSLRDYVKNLFSEEE